MFNDSPVTIMSIMYCLKYTQKNDIPIILNKINILLNKLSKLYFHVQWILDRVIYRQSQSVHVVPLEMLGTFPKAFSQAATSLG